MSWPNSLLCTQVWELTEKLGQQQREVEVAHEDASQLRRALEAATAEHTLAIQVHAAELSTACQQAERSADEAASAKQEVAALQVSDAGHVAAAPAHCSNIVFGIGHVNVNKCSPDNMMSLLILLYDVDTCLQLQLERLPEYEAELEAVAHRLESAQLEGHRLMEQVT
jgi:hypothetical protein